MQTKSIMHKAMLLCAGLFSCAVLTGCGLQSKNQVNATGYTKPASVKNFNLQKNLPHYELNSNRLSHIFTDDFNDSANFQNSRNSDSDSPGAFIMSNAKNSIAFSNSLDLPYVNQYNKLIPNLKSQLTKHTLIITQGNKNVVYKLYAVHHATIHMFFVENRVINGYKVTLIPTKYRIKSNHEKYINHAQGKHYLVNIEETEKLNHAYHRRSRYGNLPND